MKTKLSDVDQISELKEMHRWIFQTENQGKGCDSSYNSVYLTRFSGASIAISISALDSVSTKDSETTKHDQKHLSGRHGCLGAYT